jgi:hypothetical protein
MRSVTSPMRLRTWCFISKMSDRTVGVVEWVEPRFIEASDRRHWQRPVTAQAPEDDPAGARTAVGLTENAASFGGPHAALRRSTHPTTTTLVSMEPNTRAVSARNALPDLRRPARVDRSVPPVQERSALASRGRGSLRAKPPALLAIPPRRRSPDSLSTRTKLP